MLSQNQNTTDLEKALVHAHSIHKKPEITLYGCTSHRRLDHTQAALRWLTKDPSIRLLASPLQSIVFVDDKLLLPNPDRLNWRVSIIPYTKTATVNLTGMEWSGKQIVLNETRSAISNRTIGYTPSIRVTKGSVLVFIG
jgi:thiamine pyrophosphokinase